MSAASDESDAAKAMVAVFRLSGIRGDRRLPLASPANWLRLQRSKIVRLLDLRIETRSSWPRSQ